METEQPFGPKIVAGDAVSWTVSLPDFDPSLFTLKYFFRGPSKLDLVATTAGNGFALTATNAQTLALQPGIYQWQAAVFDANGNRTTLPGGVGTVEVVADIQSLPGDGSVDGRSWVKQVLDDVRALIKSNAFRPHEHYQIAGRSISFRKWDEVLTLEGEFAARYRKELVQSGQLLPQTNQVAVRF